MPKMLREKRPKASYGLAWPSREERPAIPSQCYQQSEIQLFYVSPWGKCEESCFSSHPNAVPDFSTSAEGKCRTWSWRKWIMFTLHLVGLLQRLQAAAAGQTHAWWDEVVRRTSLLPLQQGPAADEKGAWVRRMGSSSLVSTLPGRSGWIIHPMHSSGGSRRNKSGSHWFYNQKSVTDWLGKKMNHCQVFWVSWVPLMSTVWFCKQNPVAGYVPVYCEHPFAEWGLLKV